MRHIIHWRIEDELPQPPAFVPDEETDGGLTRRHVVAVLAAGVLVFTGLLGQAWAHEEIPTPAPAAVEQEGWQPPLTALDPDRWQPIFDEDVPAGALYGAPEDDGWAAPVIQASGIVRWSPWQDDDLPVLPAALDEDPWRAPAVEQQRVAIPGPWRDDPVLPAAVLSVDEEAWQLARAVEVRPVMPSPWRDGNELPIQPAALDEDAWRPAIIRQAQAVVPDAWQDEGLPVLSVDEESWQPAHPIDLVAVPRPWWDDGALPIAPAAGVPDEEAWQSAVVDLGSATWPRWLWDDEVYRVPPGVPSRVVFIASPTDAFTARAREIFRARPTPTFTPKE